MALIPIVAWIAAVVIAMVVLGFCAYEIMWKAKRLRRDLGQLQALAGEAQDLQRHLAATQQRLSSSGLVRG